MTKIFPFRGYLYDPEKIDISKSIPEAAQDGDLLIRQIEAQALVQDRDLSFYAYYLQPKDGDAAKGLIAVMEMEDPNLQHYQNEGFPDEAISKQIDSFKRTHMQTVQVLALYSDPSFRINRALDGEIAGSDPVISVTDEPGTEHLVWKITDSGAIKRVQRALQDRSINVARGGEYYQAVAEYCQAMYEQGIRARTAEKKTILAVLLNIDQPGLESLKEALESKEASSVKNLAPRIPPGLVFFKVNTNKE